jgi:4-aminobutyrate aminotransferase-like enzyme
VACAAGIAVLDALENDRLQQNALRTGEHLLRGLRELQRTHEVIGDVRGRGLFLGVDLVTDRETRAPATAQASYLKNRLRERRILIGTDGPHDNVLKIRPPMTFDRAAADTLLEELADLLREDGALP